jgi:hypothetical protein
MAKINKYQKIILFSGFILFLIINLFPPWVAWLNPPGYTESVNIGYGLLLSPPQSKFGYESYVSINYLRLLIQWVLLLVIIITGMLLAGRKTENRNEPRSVINEQ